MIPNISKDSKPYLTKINSAPYDYSMLKGSPKKIVNTQNWHFAVATNDGNLTLMNAVNNEEIL